MYVANKICFKDVLMKRYHNSIQCLTLLYGFCSQRPFNPFKPPYGNHNFVFTIIIIFTHSS